MKLIKSYLVTGAITGFLALTGCKDTPSFHDLDKDRDAAVSQREFQIGIQQHAFQWLDANDNGRIDTNEWMAYEDVRKPKQRFDRLDRNKDEGLTYSEFAEVPRKQNTLRNLFRTFDKNKDGKLTESEFVRK